MADFTLYDETNAPEGARAKLEATKKSLGFVPSLYAVFAENPAMLEAYATLGNIFGKAGFSQLEQQVVTIAASVENECHFCVAAHSTISQGQGLDMDVIAALRDDRPITEPKLEALRRFTKQVVTQRGFVADADVDAFIEAGYDRAAVLGVILGVSLKVLSNYTNHVAETPVNEQFQAHAWESKPKRATAAA
ncbi:MAG: carboxymuconolactone decarboxylase family protein [Pseudomonadota bacterium]